MSEIISFPVLIGSCSCGKDVAQRGDDPDTTLQCPECGNVIAAVQVVDAELRIRD